MSPLQELATLVLEIENNRRNTHHLGASISYASLFAKVYEGDGYARYTAPISLRTALTSTFCVEFKNEMVRDWAINTKFVTVFHRRYYFEKWNQATTAFRQCTNCWAVGHMRPECRKVRPTCELCALSHARLDHLCPTEGCGARGIQCEHIALRCANCGGPHKASNKPCVGRVVVQLAGPAAVAKAREAEKLT
ncbi:hypothetical protein BOTBODRAFT_174527 [Botryobasidium botryosum FD-172 SS1]|uniref:CCHC-type domain-containing protein n=1 Tax=Botryobasidium botryosum (strain FD-172 SS1) TaxID=930990 RepID=A0A067MS21_BOTB1|nr:hypothetical protein BOTBODRAFT_174527 [Botryobasidium botryosum FD-172 SS1]